MSYQVVIDDEAEQELKDAARWIAQYAPETAALWYFDIGEAIQTLQDSLRRAVRLLLKAGLSATKYAI